MSLVPSASSFIPLSVPRFAGQELDFVSEAIKTEWVSTAGSFIKKFESAVARYTGSRYSVACQSGTAGLHLALRALGVGSGDEVLVPTLTFIAPINCVTYLGAKPVFFDCDDSLGINIESLTRFLESRCKIGPTGVVNKLTGARIGAILPVHVFGNTVDMEALIPLAERYNIPIIEDASESLGSYYTSGQFRNRHSGTIGKIGVYSFNGNKIITTGGGGLVVTDDAEIARKILYLSNQAKDDETEYIHNDVGYNYRMTNLQAALGLAQIEQIESFIATKTSNLALYREHLDGIPGLSILPFRKNIRTNAWFYSLLVDEKLAKLSARKLMVALTAKNIQTRPIWYLNHLQMPFKNCIHFCEAGNAKSYWEKILNLPCSSNLGSHQVRRVCKEIQDLIKT